ncbi:hypothetical protein GQ600_7771 [Phytophthora cactorum]|nr:hypothetical protein GQ600_7771 [Phytophthora cactorum]
MAKILMGKCHSEMIGHAVREAASEGNHELVKLLLMECEARHLEENGRAECSVANGEVVDRQVRSTQCRTSIADGSCQRPHGYAAVICTDDWSLLQGGPLQGECAGTDSKKSQNCDGRDSGQYSDQPTMKAALLRLSSNGDLVATKLLLRKLDPASYKHTFAIAAEKMWSNWSRFCWNTWTQATSDGL